MSASPTELLEQLRRASKSASPDDPANRSDLARVAASVTALALLAVAVRRAAR